MTAAIATYQFKTFLEFSSKLSNLLFPNGIFERDRFLFRGQGSSEYNLISSFDRRFSRLPPVNKARLYENFLLVLKKEFGKVGLCNISELQMLGLAQHYGTPTRLLDWSSSPFVAAYFAFNNNLSSTLDSQRVAIWALTREHASTWSQLGLDIVSLAIEDNYRAKKQLGLASNLKTTHSHIEEFIIKIGDNKTLLWKFEIPAREAKSAFSYLDVCNIMATELFGGAEGAARTAFEQLMLNSDFA